MVIINSMEQSSKPAPIGNKKKITNIPLQSVTP